MLREALRSRGRCKDIVAREPKMQPGQVVTILTKATTAADTILAIGVGKYKSVACVYRSGDACASSRSLPPGSRWDCRRTRASSNGTQTHWASGTQPSSNWSIDSGIV